MKRKKVKQRKISPRVLFQSAAAIIILVIVSHVSFRQGNEQLKNQFTKISIEVPWGSKTKTYLPDSTLVWLNAGSTIIYSQGFGVHNRDLHLRGEAYFEVASNEKLPLKVITDEMHVNVVGTKFNFRNYPDDDAVIVNLLEGRIVVSNYMTGGEDINMEPNQKVFLNKRSGDMQIEKKNTQNSIEWINGYIFFDEDLLSDIAKRLERSYDVQITIDSSLKKLRFYGNFIRKERSVTEILDILSSTGKFKYRMDKEGKNIELNSP